MNSLITLLALLSTSSDAPPERLFVYVSRPGRTWNPEEGLIGRHPPRTEAETDRVYPGTLRGLWLPSGRAFVLPRRAGEWALSEAPRAIRVSPDGRYVAFVARPAGFPEPWLWVHDVARRRRKAIRGLTPGQPYFGLEWIGPERFLVRYQGIFTAERRADGWHTRDDYPSGPAGKRLETRLRTIGRALDRKERFQAHEALAISPDGNSVVAYALRDGGNGDEPGPAGSGLIRRNLVAYDAKTLRRRFAGPSWDETQGMDPALRRFVGWVGDCVADVGPARGGSAKLTLRGVAGVREYPLPGLVGGLWSLSGD